jgi:thiopeptide-type bacteriocin biosynthesis protein
VIPEHLYDQLCARVGEHIEQISDSQELSLQSKQDLGALVEYAGATLIRVLAETDSPSWLYLRISVEAGQGNSIMTRHVDPLLRDLEIDCQLQGWWWINKVDSCGAALRVRVSVPWQARIKLRSVLLAKLKAAGFASVVLRYEPEICLFGGPEGIRLAHDHFCAESRFLTAWMANSDQIKCPVIPEGLSLALIVAMLQASGLDIFEIWDVFSRVYAKRRFFPEVYEGSEKFGRLARKVLEAGSNEVLALYEGAAPGLLLGYKKYICQFGQELNRAYFGGRLECGLREFLTPVILFHWNRIELSPFHQFALSHAMTKELECISRACPQTEERNGT